jgi:hypothetical protein
MALKHPKRPKDFSQAAKLVIDIATGQKEDTQPQAESGINAFARAGGLKGGKARAKSLTAKERSDIAARAARARWGKRRADD